MFLCYLIDPAGRSIEKVEEGFARAAALTGSEAPEVETLWMDLADPDSSVDLVYDPDATAQPSFRLRLRRPGEVLERAIAGPAVLVACGAVPDEMAHQLASQTAVASAVEFAGAVPTAIADWLRPSVPEDRAPAQRHSSARTGQSQQHRASGPRRH